VRAFLAIRFELERLRDAARTYWRRLLVGAFAGWFVASVAGAFALIVIEQRGWLSLEDSNVAAAAIAWSGVGLGALVAYALKPETRKELE
jgi:hypothetical protein